VGIFAVHLKLLLPIGDEHAAAVIPNMSALCFGLYLHHNGGLSGRVLVLQSIRRVFPNNGMLVPEELRTLQKVAPNMAGHLQRGRGHANSPLRDRTKSRVPETASCCQPP